VATWPLAVGKATAESNSRNAVRGQRTITPHIGSLSEGGGCRAVPGLPYVFMRLAALMFVAVVCCYACDCREPSVEAKRDHAELIFRGRIVELRDSSKSEPVSPGFGRDTKNTVVFKVSRVWKGSVSQTFEMPGIEETSDCIGFWPSFLKVGADLLVYARRFGGPDYLTSICGNHKPAKNAGKDFKTLGAGNKPEQSPRSPR
jgi:hypothetical protein